MNEEIVPNLYLKEKQSNNWICDGTENLSQYKTKENKTQHSFRCRNVNNV